MLEIKTDSQFFKLCKDSVRDYVNKHLDKSDKKEISSDNVYIVWYSKSLQNWKALVSTNLFDGMYYECTFNGDKGEMYLDVYKKWENITITNDKKE